jgi:hypothetical protein
MNQLVSNDSQFSILLLMDNSSVLAVGMSAGFEDSMFTRLYFEGGSGLTKFKIAHVEGGDMVWTVS